MLRLHFVFPSVLQDNKALEIHEMGHKHKLAGQDCQHRTNVQRCVKGEYLLQDCAVCNRRNT